MWLIQLTKYIQMLGQWKPKYLSHQMVEYIDSFSQFEYDALYMKCSVPVWKIKKELDIY